MDQDSGRNSQAALDWQTLQRLLGQGADFIWEQDTGRRLVRFETVPDSLLERLSALEGRTWAELEFADASAHGTFVHALAGRLPLRGELLACTGEGTRQYVRLSGAPAHDPTGRFSGYRGWGVDVTEIHTELDDLRSFRAAIDECPEPLFVCDTDTLRFTYASNKACQLTGFPREELLKHIGPHHITQTSPEHIAQVFVEAEAPSGITMPAHLSVSKDGSRRGWWEPRHKTIMHDGRRMTVTVSLEVSARVLALEAAERAQRMYATLNATHEAIVRSSDAEDLFQRICSAAVDRGGFASASVILRNPDGPCMRLATVAGIGQQRVRDAADVTRLDGDVVHQGLIGEAMATRTASVSNDFLTDPRTTLWHPDARVIGLRAAAAIPILRDEQPIGVLLLCSGSKRAFDEETLALLQRMSQNIGYALAHQEHEANRQEAETRIRYLATHDSLTGLPNRLLFGEMMEMAIRAAGRHKRTLAVMFIDLDRFKLVNDTLGHDAGDALLRIMTERLRGALRASDVLARIGGDEFVALLPEVHLPEDALTIASKLLGVAAEPLLIKGRECRVSASIGIAAYPLHGQDTQTLLTNADAAMYKAKEAGKNGFRIHEPETKPKA